MKRLALIAISILIICSPAVADETGPNGQTAPEPPEPDMKSFWDSVEDEVLDQIEYIFENNPVEVPTS